MTTSISSYLLPGSYPLPTSTYYLSAIYYPLDLRPATCYLLPAACYLLSRHLLPATHVYLLLGE